MTMFYTFKDVQLKLKEQGLPCSRVYLNALEKAGIFPITENTVKYRTKDSSSIGKAEMRIFTLEEIDKVVEIIKTLRHDRNQEKA